MSKLEIVEAGTNYIGLSITTLFAKKNTLTVANIVSDKVEKINRRESSIQNV